MDKKKEFLTALGVNFRRLSESEAVLGADSSQASHDEFVGLRLNGVLYRQLRQVEDALERLAMGEYGTCVHCGEAIPAKRLRALPWAQDCVSCQEKVAVLVPRDTWQLRAVGSGKD